MKFFYKLGLILLIIACVFQLSSVIIYHIVVKFAMIVSYIGSGLSLLAMIAFLIAFVIKINK